jgi:hypothetical protein
MRKFSWLFFFIVMVETPYIARLKIIIYTMEKDLRTKAVALIYDNNTLSAQFTLDKIRQN